jgi:hypothetical protein
MPITNAADIDNTFVGKGIVKFKKDGETDYRDLGEVPEFEFTMTIDRLDYFSSRSGIRTKARSVIRERSAALRMIMSELTADNLALYLMGDAVAGTGTPPDVTYTVDIFSLAEITGMLRFVGTNDIGAKVQLDFGNVSFTPSASFSPISEEWGQLEVTAEVLVDDAMKYGTAIWNITAEVDPGVMMAAA